MSADLRDRLETTAVVPTRPVDLDAIDGGIRRRRRTRRWSVATVTVVVMAGAVMVGTGLVGAPRVRIDPAGPSLSATDGPTAVDTVSVAALRRQRDQLLQREAELTGRLADLEQQRTELEAQAQTGADVADELAAVSDFIDATNAELHGVQRQRLVVQGQLAQLLLDQRRPEPTPTSAADETPVTIPDVVGLGVGQAQSQLSDLGLASLVFTKPVEDPAQIGIVLAQSPLPGTIATPAPSDAPDYLTVVLSVGTSRP